MALALLPTAALTAFGIIQERDATPSRIWCVTVQVGFGPVQVN